MKLLSGKLFLYIALLFLCIICVVPLVGLISISISSEKSIMEYGYSLIPKEFSLQAYRLLLHNPQEIVNSYGVTILITTVGSLLSLMITGLLAYPLSRAYFRFRSVVSFLVFFTMLFNGGLIPYYIIVSNVYHLKDTLWALILPAAVSAWNVLIMRTFFSQLPDAIMESAKVEGAGELTVFFRLVVPLSTPVFATIGLFNVLMYWNDWFNALLFIDNRKLLPLQYLLYNLLSNAQFLRDLQTTTATNVTVDLPMETLRMAIVVLAVAPMTFVFMFFQKYFVKGMTIGAIKG